MSTSGPATRMCDHTTATNSTSRWPNLKVALVHHWFIRRGGAERVVEQLGEIFPDADLFTLLLRPEALGPSLQNRAVHTSFLQHWPGSRRFHRSLLPFYPLALESFDLSAYDLVISSESGPAKGVITRSDTCHICYCNSPMRYIWEMPHQYESSAPMGLVGKALFRWSSHYVRMWDYNTAARADYFIAGSANAAKRIHKVYRRSADAIIHSPIDLSRFAPAPNGPGDFYLVVSRLVAYKRIDLAIAACNLLSRKLVIVGDGEEKAKLQSLAGSTITFLGAIADEEVRSLYGQCRALLFPGEEDFGLVPLEAQASGRPVIAFGRGGALETIQGVVPGQDLLGATGIFFGEQTVEALVEAMLDFEGREAEFKPSLIRDYVKRFDATEFRRQIGAFVESKLYGTEGGLPPVAATQPSCLIQQS